MALTKVDTRMVYEKSIGVSQRAINRSPSSPTVPAGGVAVGSNLYADEVIEYSEGGQDYRVYVYKTSGIFIAENDVTADVLVVAGGGGGGGQVGGGGGAGGGAFRKEIALNSNSYSVVVGGGGSGMISTVNYAVVGGNAGTDSSFGNVLIAKGGGLGARYNNASDNTSGGCSGGGSSHGKTTSDSNNSVTSNFQWGYNGGSGGGVYAGGGGGGLSENGQNYVSNSQGGKGGDGITSIPAINGETGLDQTATQTLFTNCNIGELVSGNRYLGGGGGGCSSHTHTSGSATGFALGGRGGGGVGVGDSIRDAGTVTLDGKIYDFSAYTTGVDGLQNTGGGGGGVRDNYSGSNYYTRTGNGGSGIVVIRVHL